MKKLFSIGEVSKIKGITIKALRYYHKMGILIPNYVDESTGYRYYTIEQFIYIDIIKGCRELGTSIAELQTIFKERNTDKLLEFLQQKRIEAKDNINKMQEIINNIDSLGKCIKYSKDVSRNDDIEVKYFNKRYIIVHKCEELGGLKELLYYSELDKLIKKNNIKVNVNKGIIYNVKSDGSIESTYVFSEINESFNINEKKYIKVLPEGNYLILSFKKENEEERIKKIFEYIQKNKLKINSFIEIELFNDLFNIDSYSCQIQILI